MVAAVAASKAYQNGTETPAVDGTDYSSRAADLVNLSLADGPEPVSRSERMISTLIPPAQEAAAEFPR